MPNDYDEQRELSRYVWNHFFRLAEDWEKRAHRAFLAKEKARETGESLAEILRKSWIQSDDPRVAESLELGFEKFSEDACLRILAEHAHEIFINRCPQCGRIVRTPLAQQCFWCGHDWHGQSANSSIQT